MGMAGASSERAKELHSPTAATARMNSCMAQHGPSAIFRSLK